MPFIFIADSGEESFYGGIYDTKEQCSTFGFQNFLNDNKQLWNVADCNQYDDYLALFKIDERGHYLFYVDMSDEFKRIIEIEESGKKYTLDDPTDTLLFDMLIHPSYTEDISPRCKDLSNLSMEQVSKMMERFQEVFDIKIEISEFEF
jgi:hypothetical protein